jgi:F-type H+-transporting ATPase subunit a
VSVILDCGSRDRTKRLNVYKPSKFKDNVTTLFNLFCPFINFFSLERSIYFLVVINIIVVIFLLIRGRKLLPFLIEKLVVSRLFPSSTNYRVVLYSRFLLLSFLNLISLICFSYPITTTLSFNLRFAFTVWLIAIFFLIIKKNSICSFLPSNSPWYLIPFLRIVEIIRILVRPITLCFRLLANIRAGHILLSLICKLSYGGWLLGSLFGVLELLVAIVQAFVFLILVRVYLEEGYRH